MMLLPIILLAILFVLGIPVAFSLIIGCIPYFLTDPFLSAQVIVQKMITNTESVSLMAIPFFITAGSIMNESGITEKLLNLADALVGHMIGGLGQANVLLSTLMGGISGSGAADIAMECKILVPEMEKHGYDKGFSAAVTAASGCITPIIPPGVGLVVYACTVEVPVGKLLMAGYVPGILMTIGMMIVVHYISKKRGYKAVRDHMVPMKQFGKILGESLWALILPLVLIMGLRFGVFTATEGGALMAVYSLIIGKFVYKKLDLRKLPQIMLDAALSTATVMLIMCGAKVFSYYLSWARIPHMMTTAIMNVAHNKYLFLFLANILLLVMGMFMDALPCMIVIAPLLAPIAQEMGINMIQFGIIMVLNSAIGAITPPFGNYIFQTVGILKISTQKLYKELMPFVVVCLIVLFLITYIPWLATIVPYLVYGSV
jgi:tripartite ATP-independent transporter DctM subunit